MVEKEKEKIERLEKVNSELRESLDEIFSIQRQTKALIGVKSLDEVYAISENLLDSATDFIYYRIIFFDEGSGTPSIVREICPAEISIDEELVKWSLSNAEPSFIPFDSHQDPLPIKSVIILPLVGPTVNIGVVLLWVELDESEFSEHLRYVLDMIAREIAAAVENIRLNERLTQTNQFLFDVTDSVAYGIFALNGKGGVLMINANVEFLFNLVRDQILGKHFSAVFPDTVCDTIRFLINQVQEGAEVGEQEMEYEIEPGSNVSLGVSISPLTKIEDDFGYVFICRDLRLTRELVKLRELDVMKNDFVSLVSHELRTPLASIMAYSETLLMDGVVDSEAERREYIQIIFDEGKRLSRLINDVLDLSKMEAGKMAYYYEESEIKDLIEKCVLNMEGLALKKKQRLQTDLNEEHILVRLDPDRIQQVITNLLSNAIKFTGEEGWIKVQAYIDRKKDASDVDYAHVIVSDNGMGIAPNQLSSVFGKFEQVENVKHHSSGTGLGMPICRQIIENGHGGKIWIESELGKGTAVHFTLPIS